MLGPWWTGILLMLGLAGRVAGTNVEWSARSWQADEGLPDNTVVGMAQSNDGFLWVATQSGLARFDGVRFREFQGINVARTPSTLVHALFHDRQDRLWIAKDRGVLIGLDRGRLTVLTPDDGLPLLPVRMMAEDKEGALWITYIGGGVIRILGGTVRAFGVKDGLPDGGTCQLVTDKAGQLWFSKASQFGVGRDGRFLKLLDLRAQRIEPARSGGVWIYIEKQLFRYTEAGGLVKLGDLPMNRANANATILYEDRTGALWIGTTESGLFRYDGSAFTSVETSHHEILSITEDREGNVWVGTRGGGLNRLQPRSLELVDVGSGLLAEAVRSVCQDTAGDLWAVTQSGVVVRNQGHGWLNLSTNAGWRIQYAQCVAADPAGGVWIGTQYLGLFAWRNGVTTSITKSNGLAAQSVRSLLSTPAGDLWIGTESSNALQRLRAGRLQTFELPDGSGFVTAMALDSSGDVWAGTAGGMLFKCSDGTLVDETSNTLDPPEAIRSLCATSDGSLWIGYGGRGVGRLKGEGFTQFGTEQGLHDDYISQLLADQSGRLWFAGNLGVFYVPVREFEAVAEGRTPRVRSVLYGKDEGLPNLQASHGFWPGALQHTNGNLFIPMLTGLAVMNVHELKQSLRWPPIVITRVAVDGRLVAAYEPGNLTNNGNAASVADLSRGEVSLQLSPNHQRLDIEFTALSFTAPRNLAFRYRLDGLDKNWVYPGTKREAPYTRLQAGDYTFHVAACNELGVWSEPEGRISIHVLPYYWQTWTFRILISVAIGALLAGSAAWWVRLRHRRRIKLLEQQRAMDRERARIAQDLHDELGAGLTEISFGSEFAQDPGLDLPETRQHTQAIGNRARELVAALDEIVWAVNPKNDTVASLGSYLCQYAERFLKPTRVRLRLQVARDLPLAPLNADERHHLFLAIKEALHNVVQHSRATDVQLSIAVEAGVLAIVVRDNGCGFDPAAARSEADGLGNMRRRLQQINGSHELVSRLGTGTTATFKFPLHQAASAVAH